MAAADPDFGRYLDARWPDLVGGLEVTLSER